MANIQTPEERKIDETRRASILRYVIEHPNCTKSDVIRYMKGRSAVRTTHGILISLIKEGKISLQKKHTQTHLLTINDNNDFIRLYKQLDELYMFTHEARRNIPWSHLKYYKTKPPMKYQGINGFENSFRQLFNIITQVLELQIPRTSRSREQEDTQNSDWRLLDDKIKFIFFNLAYFDWSKDTTKEVVDFSSKNIQEFFENLGNHKAKLIKMMEANDIERLDKFLKFGNKLSEMIDKFKKEYSDYYSPH